MRKEKQAELTAADVWAMLAENAKAIAETRRSIAETSEQMKKTDEKLDKLCDQIGGIGNNAGFHAEQFFQDTLSETLAFGGQKYDCLISNLMCNGKNDTTDFDIVLVNGKSVAIIEVKNRIHPNFVKELAEERIAKFRKFFPVYQKHKAYLGIAGFSFSKTVREQAKKYGVGIIKQVGKSIEIDADKLKAY